MVLVKMVLVNSASSDPSSEDHFQTVSTQSPSSISSSAVMSGQRKCRAVATMALSAGSRIAANDIDSSNTSNVYAWIRKFVERSSSSAQRRNRTFKRTVFLSASRLISSKTTIGTMMECLPCSVSCKIRRARFPRRFLRFEDQNMSGCVSVT